jgi:tRNA-Thr(GGU) m(6)t(6)A37 methyltransferase TsaA
MPVDRQDNSRDRQQIMLRAIGRVISPDAVEPKEIEIAPGFANGLDGVEEHEHLWILYWMHRLADADRRMLQAHARGDTTQPERGVFALHSPMRPNPIGMTRVRLVKREGNRLLVEGLDALEGSPVLDIKSG